MLKSEKIEIPIEKGIKDKSKIEIKGKGNEHPEYRTGDLIVVVQVEEDKVYQRVKNDLILVKKISLIESLSGFAFNLKHISDLEITIETQKNQIIKHNDVLKVPNLGMPKYKQTFSFGDLIVRFEVIMPVKFSEEQIEALKQILPKPLLPPAKETKNTYTLEQYQLNKNHKNDQYEEEDEGHGGFREKKIECNHQ